MLPSSGRELILSYRISSPDAATSGTKLCLISHPLARLGGSKEDHVVRSLTEALVEQSYLVVTYDSRSAGGSSGSCSFTSLPEADDFAYLVQHLLLPLASPSPPNQARAEIECLLIGYSAGSLSSSVCPPPTSNQSFNIRTRVILLSYTLSVRFALTAFHSSTFETRLRAILAAGTQMLIIWGDSDQFTAMDKYRNWVLELGGVMGRGIDHLEIEQSDHFWRGPTKDEMIQGIIKWIDS